MSVADSRMRLPASIIIESGREVAGSASRKLVLCSIQREFMAPLRCAEFAFFFETRVVCGKVTKEERSGHFG
jgi:hypothetical protein